MIHIVYCDNTGKQGDRELDMILSGEKTMVIRGAAGRKIPHSRVFEGESLYFMEKGSGLISVSASVKSVQNYVKLSEEEIEKTLEENQSKLRLTGRQKERWHKKCLCIVEFETARRLDPPLRFDHQSNMDDWLIIEKIEDVLVGTSVTYNYEKSKL